MFSLAVADGSVNYSFHRHLRTTCESSAGEAIDSVVASRLRASQLPLPLMGRVDRAATGHSSPRGGPGGRQHFLPRGKGKKHETGVIFVEGYVEKGCTKMHFKTKCLFRRRLCREGLYKMLFKTNCLFQNHWV
jgi:hypothetical protein